MSQTGSARAAVLSVYRAIMRHSRRIDGSLKSKIRKQFKRHKRSNKIGHLRAAYELEKDLRAVHEGELTVQQLIDRYKVAKTQTPEKNSTARRMIWALQPERVWDKFNYPAVVTPGMKKAAQVANLRSRYIRFKNLADKDVDKSIIDVVFAPLWQDGRKHSAKQRSGGPHLSPRSVSIHTVTRNGELSVLRVQGKNARHKGFRRHVERVSVDNPKSSKYQQLEVNRRILIDRAARLERKWAYRFHHGGCKSNVRASRATYRLSSLVAGEGL